MVSQGKMDLLEKLGLLKQVERLKKDMCPDCGDTIVMAEFKDRLSIRKYNISGLCQRCQDEVFRKTLRGE